MVFANISRKQAFLTHLLVSTGIFLALSWLIVFHWYPDFYFFLDGGDRAIATVFFVDVVLGPGLTLLVFKPGKKSLKFDMSVILLVQLAALLWGVSNVYSERSATAVFYQGKFTCISQPDASAIDLSAIKAGPSQKQALGFLQRPDTIDELLDFTKEAYAHGSSSVYYYGSLIQPLDSSVIARLDKYHLNTEALAEENPEYASHVERYLQSVSDNAAKPQLIPIACRYGNAIAVYDRNDMKITEILDVPTFLSADALDEPLPLKEQTGDSLMKGIVEDLVQETK